MEGSGYIFPNEAEVTWSLMIVLYPYITGLVAGAFIVSSLYHVFGVKQFKPISRFSLLASLSFLLFATTPLLAHLGHPERAFNIMVTPNFSSAMAGFGFLYSFYMIVLVLEVWLVCRQDIIYQARRSRGIRRMVFKVLALGVYDTSPETVRSDARVIKFLAAIGIPAACALHGYVGFLFGAIKANPWWSTPLMPIIFLFSAIVSGIAMLLIMYQIACWFSQRPVDNECIRGLVRILWYFLIVAVCLETLEIVTLAYEGAEEWAVIKPLLTEKLAFSFLGLQVILGSMIPMILLTVLVLMEKGIHDRTRNVLGFISAALLLVQVMAMRWNVVIGGQTFSKSFHGYRTPYVPELWGREGLAMGIAILAMPFVLLIVFSRLIPLLHELTPKVEAPAEPQVAQ